MGADKGLVAFHGAPLILHAINILMPICHDLIICSNNPEYERFGIRVQPDLIGHIGPMGGIYSGLIASSTPDNLVLSCDMPLITAPMIRLLLKHRSARKITIPVHPSKRVEPLFGIYPVEFIEQLRESIENGKLGISDLFNRIPVCYLEIEKHPDVFHSDAFFNINTPTDLAKAEVLYRKY
jgi:molybdopterin-guanine dinucleotide biosynthesis protein A